MQLRGTGIVVDTISAKANVLSGSAMVSGSGTTVTLNDLQSDSVVLLDRNAGMTIVLPDGKPGTKYEFIVSQNLSANSYIITGTAASNSYAIIGAVSATNDLNIASGTLFTSTSGPYLLNQRVVLNGAVTGGRLGTRIIATSLSQHTWHIAGVVVGSGVMLSPFSA